MNCPARVKLLAQLRQRALELALEWQDWNVLISVDLDFVSFDAVSLLQMVALGQRLGVLAIFGSSVRENGRTPYDVNAIAPSRALDAIADFCLTRVRSAFGGFGAYFSAGGDFRRTSARYDVADHKRSHRAVCEHVNFNAQLQSAHPLRLMLVDPRFRPIYAFASDPWHARRMSNLVGKNGGCSDSFNCTEIHVDCASWDRCNAAHKPMWSRQAGPENEHDVGNGDCALFGDTDHAPLSARFIADITPQPGKSMWTSLLWEESSGTYHSFTGMRGPNRRLQRGLTYERLSKAFSPIQGTLQQLSSRVGRTQMEDPRVMRLHDGAILLMFQRYLWPLTAALASWAPDGSMRQPQLSTFFMTFRHSAKETCASRPLPQTQQHASPWHHNASFAMQLAGMSFVRKIGCLCKTASGQKNLDSSPLPKLKTSQPWCLSIRCTHL